MSFLEEAEHGKLEEKIRQIEILLAHGIAEGGSVTTSALVVALEAAKKRVEKMETVQKIEVEEKEKKSVSELVVMYHVQKETALTPREREQYGSFLELEYFTRADFDRLAGFYAHSWDRLTEDGKAQMSHRVWEGIRHGEFTFGQLPEQVREKEAGRIYQQFSGKGGDDLKTHAIPAKDREDFIREYEAGNKAQAVEVLNRKSFVEQISRTSAPQSRQDLLAREFALGAQSRQSSASQDDLPKNNAEDLLQGIAISPADSTSTPILPPKSVPTSHER